MTEEYAPMGMDDVIDFSDVKGLEPFDPCRIAWTCIKAEAKVANTKEPWMTPLNDESSRSIIGSWILPIFRQAKKKAMTGQTHTL